MTSKFTAGCFSILVAALLLGCGRPDEGAVFAVIDGRPLTESYVRKVVELQACMAKMRGQAIPDDHFARWANGTAMQIIPQLISADLWQAEIARAGEKPEQCDIDKCLFDFRRSTRRTVSHPDQIAGLFPAELGAVAREQFDRSAAYAAYMRRHFEVSVTDQELANHCHVQTNRLALARMIDAAARSRGDAAWKRLEAGEAWKKVAEEVSEDSLVDEENKEFAEDWATVGSDAMGYEELAKALPSLKEGGYSKPLETEEGLIIVRLNKKIGADYVLSRILFRMAQPVELQSVEAMRASLQAEKRTQALLKTNEELVKKAHIEYPLGTNFTYKIWKADQNAKGAGK